MIIFDHIAISGTSLEEASAYVESRLGVCLQDGGSHVRYGTHNRLLGLKDGLYLEAIAIDPTVKPPAYPRWFDLDNFKSSPRITNWICKSENIEDDVKSFFDKKIEIIQMQRNDLNWLMGIPFNGILPFNGCFPALLQWQTTEHPRIKLNDSGCQLKHMTILHPECAALKKRLAIQLRMIQL